jgi:hypothetical protein
MKALAPFFIIKPPGRTAGVKINKALFELRRQLKSFDIVNRSDPRGRRGISAFTGAA